MVARGRLHAAAVSYMEPWDVCAMSALVESLLAGLPVGEMLAGGEPRQGLCLIDGARRLSALCLFCGVEPPWSHAAGTAGFRLAGLALLPQLEGCSYTDLSDREDFRTVLDNAGVHFCTIVDGMKQGPLPSALRNRMHA